MKKEQKLKAYEKNGQVSAVELGVRSYPPEKRKKNKKKEKERIAHVLLEAFPNSKQEKHSFHMSIVELG